MEMPWDCFFVNPYPEETPASTFTSSEDMHEIHYYSYGPYFEMCQYTWYRISQPEYTIDWTKINLVHLYLVHLMSYQEIYRNPSPEVTSLDKINHIDFIAWIHLDISVEREKRMRALWREKNHICFPAFDTSLVVSDFFVCEEDVSYPPQSLAEYATTLSHLHCIDMCSRIPNTLYENVLICEDDVSLEFYEAWTSDFAEIIAQAPPDWEILSLGYYNTSMSVRKKKYSLWLGEWGACAYIIHKERCRQRIPQLRQDNKWIVHSQDSMVADYYVFYYFKTYVYQDSYFTTPNTNDSVIHPDHLPYHMLYKKYNIVHLKHLKERDFPQYS
jgi:GR25 family glycosyltransferase involved in LPS biosynthesis